MCYCGCGVLPCLRAVFYCLRCVCLCWPGLCLNIINNTAPNYIPFVNVPMRCSALVDISDDTDAVLISVLMIDNVLVVCVCVRVAYVDVLVFFFVLVVFVLSLLPLACLLFFLILDGWLCLACLMFCVLPLIVTRYVSDVLIRVVVVLVVVVFVVLT